MVYNVQCIMYNVLFAIYQYDQIYIPLLFCYMHYIHYNIQYICNILFYAGMQFISLFNIKEIKKGKQLHKKYKYLTLLKYCSYYFIMLNTNNNTKYAIFVLIVQFWLSGLWILSLIFTASDQEQLQQINMIMFITLGFGSLVGGYLSDIIDRIVIFKWTSVIWLCSSIIIIFSMQIGYIIAAGAIGLLNNLSFVIIMENWSSSKDIYTIYVLIGWASSQITLGLLFYLIQQSEVYYGLLFGLTLLYTVAVFLFLKSNNNHRNQCMKDQIIQADSRLQQSLNPSKTQPNSLLTEQQTTYSLTMSKICKRILPHSILALLGGSILMFVMQMFYYRTQFTLDRFGIGLQLNFIIVGIMQVIANVIFTQFINRYPRNAILRVFIILLAGLFFGLVFISNKAVQTLIQGIMRLFDTCIMIILGVYLPQLFDEDQRGKGTNYVMSFGVLGSALNGIILNHFQFWQLIFFLLVGFLATFCFKQTLPSANNIQKQQEQIQKIPEYVSI